MDLCKNEDLKKKKEKLGVEEKEEMLLGNRERNEQEEIREKEYKIETKLVIENTEKESMIEERQNEVEEEENEEQLKSRNREKTYKEKNQEKYEEELKNMDQEKDNKSKEHERCEQKKKKSVDNLKSTNNEKSVSALELLPNSNFLDESYLDRKLNRLLELTDRYSSRIICGRETSSKNKVSLSKGRLHMLTEKEEDDILLKEAEEDEEDKDCKISVQPKCIHGCMKPYQIEGLNWLYQLYRLKINGILADEMGLGKTLQSISLLGFLHFEKMIIQAKHLVICPRSTLDNWFNEINKWCPRLRSVRFHGNKEERDLIVQNYLKNEKFDVCLTTYEMVILEKFRLSRMHWCYLIMDEAHRIKNEKSILSDVVRSLTSDHRLLITGTPLQNNLKELWSLLNFLMPQLFDSSSDFEKLFDLSRMSSAEGVSSEKQAKIIKTLHRILRPFMLRRLKCDVETALHPKREVYIFVGMSKLQKKLYADILSKNIEVLHSITKNKTQMLNVLMQLRKCCNHPYLFDGVEEGPPYVEGQHLVDVAGKMSLLDKLLPRLKSEQSRVLIFSQMTRLLDIADDYLRWKGYSYCRIDGSTAGADRQERIDEFNKPNSEKFIFLLSTRAGGLGINLATADVVILFDSDFNPQMDLQAMDRAHRIGQKKKVVVYRFVTENSVEERIVERAAKKLKLDSLIIQKGRFSSNNSNQAEAHEIHDILFFGAQEVYKTQNDSSICEADIDAILADADQRTSEIEKQLLSLENKFNLSNLSLDGGLNMYEGKQDDLKKKKVLKVQAPEFFDLGDRKTKWKPIERKVKKPSRRILTGWRAEVQGGYDFQFFDVARLDKLEEIKTSWEEYEAKKNAKTEKQEDNEIDKKALNVKEKTEGSSESPLLSLKMLDEDQLRRVLHTLEFHMGISIDHSNEFKSKLYRRARELLTDSSNRDDYVFQSNNFNEALLILEKKLEDGSAWKEHIPAATFNRCGRALRSATKSDCNASDATTSSYANELRTSQEKETKLLGAPSSSNEQSKVKKAKAEKKKKKDKNLPTVFSNEFKKERQRLLSEGFITWSRSDYTKFVNLLTLYGRQNLKDIWKNGFAETKSLNEIEKYANVFFKKYHLIEGGEKVMSRIIRAESMRNAVANQNQAIFHHVEKQLKLGVRSPKDLSLVENIPVSTVFTPEEDKVLLWGLYEHGCTAYNIIHAACRYYWYSSRGFFLMATKTLKQIEDRCKQIVTATEESYKKFKEKKHKKSKHTVSKLSSVRLKRKRIIGMESKSDNLEEREESSPKEINDTCGIRANRYKNVKKKKRLVSDKHK